MNINWYPGHMVKAKKQILEDLKLIDVVIEIIDSRIPIASRNPDIAEMIKEKKKIIVLNKCDLADEKETIKWVAYFKSQGIIAIPADSNSGKGIETVMKSVQEVMKEQLEKSSQKGRTGKTIRLLILGIPNVGKSSFINRIAKRTSAEVGNRPGVTKQKQWIRLGNNIELMDTPGVLWPKFESEEIALNLAYTGTIKDEVIDKVEVSFRLLKYLLENHKQAVVERYKITEDVINQELAKQQDESLNLLDIFYLICKKRGAVVSGGKIDEEKTANILLEDFRSGKLGRITIETVK